MHFMKMKHPKQSRRSNLGRDEEGWRKGGVRMYCRIFLPCLLLILAFTAATQRAILQLQATTTTASSGQNDASFLPPSLWETATTTSLSEAVSNSMANLNTFTSILIDGDESSPRIMLEPMVSIPKVDAPFEWAACLLVKDENLVLPEWIAYHMEVLPLRRLIIGKDPNAKTDPRLVLNEFERELGLNATVWEYDDYFFTNGQAWYSQKNYTHVNYENGTSKLVPKEEAYHFHRWRQQTFLSSCMRQLKKEGVWTWTLLVDPDEFIFFNPYTADGDGMPFYCHEQPKENWSKCTEDYHTLMEKGTELRNKLPTVGEINSTMAHYLASNMEAMLAFNSYFKLPCHVLPRVSVGSHEPDNAADLLKDYLPDDSFDYKQFFTLRFRQHEPMQNSIPGKSILDASRYNNQHVTNPHRVLRSKFCFGGPFVKHFANVFRVQHYTGSLEVFLARGKRQNQFESRQPKEIVGESWESIRWLQSFARRVGPNRAKFLTQDLTRRAYAEYAQAFGSKGGTVTASPVVKEAGREEHVTPLSSNNPSSNLLLEQKSIPKVEAPFEWAACLLVRDENLVLPEWIAYHMEVLPLRRLIIGNDPTAKTDPHLVADEFEREVGLNVTVWEYDDYFYPGRWSSEQKNYTHFLFDNGTAIPVTLKQDAHSFHRWRQQAFLTSCMRQLKKEAWTWTLLVDPDEFLFYNPYSIKGDGMPYHCWEMTVGRGNKTPQKRRAKAKCYEDYHALMQNGTELRSKLPTFGDPNSTIAHYLDSHMDAMIDYNSYFKLPCHVLPRIQVGSHEHSDAGDRLKDYLPDDSFDYTQFFTLRFRQHEPMQNMVPGKSIVDASRYDKQHIANPHKAMKKELCNGGPHVKHYTNIFRVHHYTGSLQVFLARGKWEYQFHDRQPKEIVGETWESIRWLKLFAARVGPNRAKFLTQDLTRRAYAEYAEAFGAFPNVNNSVSIALEGGLAD